MDHDHDLAHGAGIPHNINLARHLLLVGVQLLPCASQFSQYHALSDPSL